MMKIIATLMILSFTLTSCSVYKGSKRIEQYPAKYEYRCVGELCKEVNMNYKYEYIPKDEYKNLSEEELKKKNKKRNKIADYIGGSLYFGAIGSIGINTAINTWGGGISGAATGLGWGFLASIGTIGAIGITILLFPYPCSSSGEEKYYDQNCSVKKQKPAEVQGK